MKDTASITALKDISKEIDFAMDSKDVYIVTPNTMRTKKTTYLNRLLGIYSLNHLGNKKGLKNKSK